VESLPWWARAATATNLLTRPAVSVRYGVWYLDKMLEQTDGDWIAALVAYNAGPGNLSRWTGDAPIADHDLFYETIPLTEPQSYVRLIYPFYAHYRALYR
jgi:soluble lytic murein transglycosylase